MTLSLAHLFGVFAVSLLFSGTFSMLEAAVISQDKHRLHHLADENDKRAIIMQRLLARTDRLLSTLLLCNNLANVTCAAAATAIATRLLPDTDAALVWVTLIVTFILLVFSEITPKVIGVRYSSAIALALAWFLHGLVRLLRPLTAIANFFSDALLRLGGLKNSQPWQAVISLKELRAAVRAAARAKDHNRDHYHLLEKALRFNDLTAEKIMTPRHALHGVNLQEDAAAMRRRIEKTRCSKLPIFDGAPENAVGVVDTLQALKLVNDGALSAEALRGVSRPVNFIPAAAGALQQLEKMRQRRDRLALVVDGNGRVTGVLTHANFAAAIIGDETPPPVTKRADGALLVPGEMTVLQLEQLQPGARAPEEIDNTTVSGMIVEHLGDLPEHYPVCLTLGDWRFEVLTVKDEYITEAALLPPPDRAEDVHLTADDDS